jgi:hypothetical protein
MIEWYHFGESTPKEQKMTKSDKMQVQQIFRGEKYEEILAI